MTLTQDDLRLAIQVLGGPKAAARMLGCSDTLVRHWLTGRRLITAPKALRLRELITAVNSALPGIAYNLKIAAQQAEERLSRWRAQRPRWQPARGDKPRLTSLERSERRWRDREIARRVVAGETIAELAEEYRASPSTVAGWARRGGRLKQSTRGADRKPKEHAMTLDRIGGARVRYGESANGGTRSPVT